MTFQSGQSGNPGGRQKDRPFQTALRMEALLAEQGQVCEAPKGSLRHIARQLLERASDDTVSAREVADRLDGRSVQVVEDTNGNEVNVLGHDEMVVEFTRLIQDLNLGETKKLTVRRNVKAPRRLSGTGED